MHERFCKLFLLAGLLPWSWLGLSLQAAEEELLKRGATIYAEGCADCHGERGQGVSGAYDDPLVGDESVGQLAALIAQTMPEGEPELCVGPDADAVAAYIHHSFYSEAAQLRNRPPRISLARLTANQLRQSLADLYEQFEGRRSDLESGGVSGAYFQGTRWKDENKKISRVDPVINFDFAHDGPGSEIDPEEFYIHWEGGLRADVSGRYEIVVSSTCSFTMDFGRIGRQLIDNHTQSGDKTEFREVLQLTAGRMYPFKIDFIQRKRKTEQPPAKITLAWVPPGGVQQVIPPENLIRTTPPPSFALQTALPPDDRSYGFERGVAINREWDESTTSAALEFGHIAATELWPAYLRRQRSNAGTERDKMRDFLTQIVRTAFRQPLSDELIETYITKQLAAEPDDAVAIQRALLISLKSPRFLYPSADADQTASQRVANRLALILYDSLPTDPVLLKAVAENKFQSEDQVRAYVQKQLNDPRLRAKTRSMLHEWLNLGQLTDISKNPEHFPGFDSVLVNDLKRSLDAFLDELVWGESGDFRQAFESQTVFTTRRIAQFYGDDWRPAEAAADTATENTAAEVKATENTAAEVKVVDTAAEDTVAEDTVAEDTVAEDTVAEDTAAEDTASKNTVAADTVAKESDDRLVLAQRASERPRLGVLTHPYLLSGLAYHDASSPIHRGVFLIRYVLGRTLRPPAEAFSPLSPDLHPELTTRQRVGLQTSPESCQVCHVKINGLGFTLENYDAVGRFRKQEQSQPVDASGRYTTRADSLEEFSNPEDLAQYLVRSEDAQRAIVNRAFQHFVKQPPAAFGGQTVDELQAKFAAGGYKIRELIVDIAVLAATYPIESDNANIAATQP